MTTLSPTAQSAALKRPHTPDEPLPDAPQTTPTPASSAVPRTPTNRGNTTSSAAVSNFRNVSACNRCRLRKNRCDQRLPACTACEKVSHRCVGFDPITKQEIPRSYVYYLESRVSYLESLLLEDNVDFEVADAFDDGSIRGEGVALSTRAIPGTKSDTTAKPLSKRSSKRDEGEKSQDVERLDKIVDNIGMVTVHGASDRRYLGSTSGISFARVVLAAVKSSVAASNPDRTTTKPNQQPKNAPSGGSSMRDSYFGLSTKPTIKEAPFPDRSLGEKLVNLYFHHANCQIPILHREEFLVIFNHAYSIGPQERTPKQLYLLNIVFAIGAGIIFGSSDQEAHEANASPSTSKRLRLSSTTQAQPEEYHASAIVHLSAFLSASSLSDGQEKAGGDLDDLQAVLLLAGFALLRPVAPGLWYIVGVAMRLAVDLGLHFEDGLGLNVRDDEPQHRRPSLASMHSKERGKREWMRDLRRRLWWCTYCFDRLVSTCVGRPFGVTDVVVTTEFYSLLDDKYITRAGIERPLSNNEPSYKLVGHHYLRLRLLQSEILQVLQYQQAQQARNRGVNRNNQYVHKNAPSPFLVRYPDFRGWRTDMDQRLWEWKESAPSDTQTGVTFPTQFLELNYWQAVIMLYRNSLSVPDQLATERSPTAEVSSPTSPPAEMEEDQDLVFLKCAEAGQKTLKIYRQLHRRRLVNYTYLATHHLFMAGISFLYAVWHSPAVRRKLTLDDFDFTVLAATSVLGDLMSKCPPAESCRDAFERMSKATVQMCVSTPGFGFGLQEQSTHHTFPMTPSPSLPHTQEPFSPILNSNQNRRPPPRFDMDLRDLFPEDLDHHSRPSRSIPQAAIHDVRNRRSRQEYGSRSHNYTSRQPINAPGGSVLPNMNEAFSPSSQQPHISQMLSTQTSPDTSMSYLDTNQNSYNPDFMSNLPGLDFLNSLTRSSNTEQYGSNNNGPRPSIPQPADDTNSSNDHNFEGSMSDSMMDYGNVDFSPAFNFGDNVGFDFNQQHDWGNGQNGFDLFGGYFFDRNGG